MELPKEIETFNEIDTDQLHHPDFGSKNFGEISDDFEDSRMLIAQMVEIAYGSESFPKSLSDQVLGIVKRFNGIYNQIRNYSIDSDQNFSKRSAIVKDYNNWSKFNWTGKDQSNNPQNFLQIYNTCKNLDKKTAGDDTEKLKMYLSDAKKADVDIKSILDQLRTKAGSETVQDYANIFKEQAEKHSHVEIELKPWKWNLGAAQYWMMVAIISVVVVLLAIGNLHKLFLYAETDPTGVKVIQHIMRIAVLSFLVYIVSFFFKQYSIAKHLYTLNKHRQNVLNSYKLFLESVDREDSTIRNALMMEVAKSIYESGSTGHINTKGSDSSASIIELTRMINTER